MSESEKNDGVPNHKLTGKAGYAVVIAVITYIFGGPIVGILFEISNPDELAVYDKRIEDLEKTVYLMEHGLLNTKLMCTSNMRVVSHAEDEEEFFDQ